MRNCAEHKKEVAGISDMKVLAEMIGDLHYETLWKLLDSLSDKLYEDFKKDWDAGRTKIATALKLASEFTVSASHEIEQAWQISKPFMK